MIICNPLTISALTGGTGANASYPLSNLLNDNPNLFFETEFTSTLSTTIVVSSTSPVDSVCLLRVYAATVTITVGGSAPAGLTTIEIDDQYYTGAKSYWWRFTTLSAPTITITLTRVSGGRLLRASCVKVGGTFEFAGVQFPVEESAIDPTPEVPLIDGYIFRGVEVPPYRTFSASVLAERASIISMVDLCRVLGGLATFWHISPDLGDYFFLFGRLAAQPSVTHAYPTLSVAALQLKEIM